MSDRREAIGDAQRATRGAAVAVVVLAAIAAIVALAVSGPASARCVADGWCPGPPPPPLPGIAPRAYLPLVIRSGEGTPACQEECAEPNDDPFHTCTMAAPGPRCGRLSFYQDEWGLHDDLADWYRLDIACAFTLTLSLDGPDGADFDLYVYGDPPGAPLAWGGSAGPDETLSLPVSPGRYYVAPTRVQGEGVYRLEFGRQP